MIFIWSVLFWFDFISWEGYFTSHFDLNIRKHQRRMLDYDEFKNDGRMVTGA